MKYFLDTEFIERFTKPVIFGCPKPRHVIDLISIGIVAEDGRKYSAISSEYEYEHASDWVKENVIMPLYRSTVHGDQRNVYHIHDFHRFFGKTNREIAADVFGFVNPDLGGHISHYLPSKNDSHLLLHNVVIKDEHYYAQPEFYGYFCDYDWVLICSLYGTMMQLPNGFPMYCRDLKQTLDEIALEYYVTNYFPAGTEVSSFLLVDALAIFKKQPFYPVNKNAHDAVADALWNRELYNCLQLQKDKSSGNKSIMDKLPKFESPHPLKKNGWVYQISGENRDKFMRYSATDEECVYAIPQSNVQVYSVFDANGKDTNNRITYDKFLQMQRLGMIVPLGMMKY